MKLAFPSLLASSVTGPERERHAAPRGAERESALNFPVVPFRPYRPWGGLLPLSESDACDALAQGSSRHAIGIVNASSPCVDPPQATHPRLIDPAVANTRRLTLMRFAERIRGGDVASLDREPVPDQDAAAVAELCMLDAETHPREIAVLLFRNAKVAECAKELLQEEAWDADDQVTMAKCLLNAGVSLRHARVSPAVERFLQARGEADEAHWREKHRKHGSGEDFYSFRLSPYFHRGAGYDRTLRVNCKLPSSTGVPLTCADHSQATDGAPASVKHHFANVVRGDGRSLDYEMVRAKHEHFEDAPGINFVPWSFGRILTRIALDLGPDEWCSFPVRWRNEDTRGHQMRVFLRRGDAGREDRLKVGLFEPNVTGDFLHEELYPEQLHELHFDDMDSMQVRKVSGMEVMTLTLKNLSHEPPAFRGTALAEAYAGAFVPQEFDLLVSSAGQALAFGNVTELQSALAGLTQVVSRPGSTFALDRQHMVELSSGLRLAYRLGHEAAFVQLVEWASGQGAWASQLRRMLGHILPAGARARSAP